MDTAFLLDQLHREQRDDPWHGPSMQAVLDDVEAGMAASKPLPGVHSIWEIVLHLTSWSREVARRLRDGTARNPEDGDWPPVPSPITDAAWRDAIVRLQAAQGELRAAIEQLPAPRWSTMVEDKRDPALGTGVTYQQMVYGVLQHETYHAGQMALLAKAAAAAGSAEPTA